MRAIPLASSFMLGVAIAFLLFILMAALIKMSDVELDKSKGTKIADFTMPKVEIEAQVDDDLPEMDDILDEPPPEQELLDIDLDTGDSGLSLGVVSDGLDQEVSTDFGAGSDSDALPLNFVQPRYPARAERQCKAGYAVVSVTITPTGTTTDIQLVEEDPPNFGFGKSAVKAAERLQYAPKIVDGEGVPVPGVLYKFTFSGCE